MNSVLLFKEDELPEKSDAKKSGSHNGGPVTSGRF